MKYRLLILMLLPVICWGQAIKVTIATKQNWFGGVAGMRGSRFNIHLISSDEIRFTRLWADGHSVALDTDNGSIKTGKKGKLKTYIINTNISYGRAQVPAEDQGAAREPEAPVAYKVAALLAYKWQGKTKYYVVKDMHSLQPVSYP